MNVTDLLIKKEAKLHLLNYEGQTPLAVSQDNGYLLEFTSVLRQNGKKLADDYSQDGLGVLLQVISDGDFTQFNELMGRIKLDQIYEDSGKTPLIVAAENGDQGMLESLILNNGASISFANRDGLTPLHAAVINGHDMIVEFLINYGASVSARDRHGFTPLMNAADNNHESIASYLLSHKANKYDKDSNDLTAAAHAYAKGHETLGKLIENWGNIGATTETYTFDRYTTTQRNYRMYG